MPSYIIDIIKIAYCKTDISYIKQILLINIILNNLYPLSSILNNKANIPLILCLFLSPYLPSYIIAVSGPIDSVLGSVDLISTILYSANNRYIEGNNQ